MSATFDPAASMAITVAKRTLAEGAELDVRTLVAALCQSQPVLARVPQLAVLLAIGRPQPRRETVGLVRMELALRGPMHRLRHGRAEAGAAEIGAFELLRAILNDADCCSALAAAGVAAPSLDQARALLPPVPLNPAARAMLEHYGRLIEETGPLHPSLAPAEPVLVQLVQTLGQRKHRSAIVVGPVGSGKTSVVHELGMRMVARHSSIPMNLWDHCLFDLQPYLLRFGAYRAGEFEQRVQRLVAVLSTHSRLVLFIDDVHTLFARGPSDAFQELWQAIAAGRIACIGCASPAEYRQHIECDESLAQVFCKIRLDPPTPEQTVQILSLHKAAIESCCGVSIPTGLLAKTVALVERWLPDSRQPRDAIQFLELAARERRDAVPPGLELDEPFLTDVLERKIGVPILHAARLTAGDVFKALSAKIAGQTEPLRELSDAFVAKLGSFHSERGPRGVFLFAGPTGVGKTQAALELACILGAGRDCLVRIDANKLEGSGYDLGPATAELFGPPPGYTGYVRGQGAALGQVREFPESIVLFDEIEKAPPGVANLLLQILDEGRTQDMDGQVLDFRHSFIVFTTNAGNGGHGANPIGLSARDNVSRAGSEQDRVLSVLHRMGFSDEFLGRIDRTFVFAPLGRGAIREVFMLRLADIKAELVRRGLSLEVPPGLEDHIVGDWSPQFGARHVMHRFERELIDQLNLAESEKQLTNIRRVRLAVSPGQGKRRTIDGDALVIVIS
jgi:ATP-dependent Clp protease ATP-binding subunit ClpA